MSACPPSKSQRRYLCPCATCKNDPRRKQLLQTINLHRKRDQEASAKDSLGLYAAMPGVQQPRGLKVSSDEGLRLQAASVREQERLTPVEDILRDSGTQGIATTAPVDSAAAHVRSVSVEECEDNEGLCSPIGGSIYGDIGILEPSHGDRDAHSDAESDPDSYTGYSTPRSCSPASGDEEEICDIPRDDPLYASLEEVCKQSASPDDLPRCTPGQLPPAFNEHPMIRRAYVQAFIAVAFHGATHELAQYLLQSSRSQLVSFSLISGYDIPGLANMAVTLRTAERRLGLDPDEHITYHLLCNVCWDCHHPGLLESLPADGLCIQDGCHGILFQKKRYSDGKTRRVPVKVLATTSPKAAIQRLLLRPAAVSIEDWAGSMDDDYRMFDMHDGWGWNAIRAGLKRRQGGPWGVVDVDVEELNQRFVALPNGLVLIFNLDWFRAMRRGNYSVGAIYLTVCNNPRSKRFLREETFLLATIPGPDEPSLEQLNHILQVFIPDLLELYDGIEMGVFGQEEPQPVNCFLYANASDLPAARKASGLRGHTSKWFMCPVCKQPLHSLTDPRCFDPDHLEYRDENRFLKYAYRARDADPITREEIAEERGVRWSALNALPDWLPVTSTPTEFMHAAFLGEAKHVVQGILTVGGMFAKRNRHHHPLKQFEEWIDDLWWPGTAGRLPKGLLTAGTGKADQWRNMVAVLPVGLYEAWQEDGIIPDSDAPALKSKQKAAIKARRVAALVKERRQAAAAFDPGTTIDDLEYIEQTSMDRNYRSHYGTVLEWCTAIRIWASQSISVAEARRAQDCHNRACQEWAAMFCHLTPYFHFLVHFLIFVLRFGPVYAWWAYVYERFNGWLSKVNHNGHQGGELEATMMRSWTKLHLIHDLIVQLQGFSDPLSHKDQASVQDLKECLRGQNRPARSRGTLLSMIAAMTAEDSGELIKFPRQSQKRNLRAQGLYSLIFHYLREAWKNDINLIPDTSFSEDGSPFIAVTVPFYSHLLVGGQRYGTSTTYHGKRHCYAYIDGRQPVDIIHILRIVHTREDDNLEELPPLTAGLAVVRPFLPSPHADEMPWAARATDLGIDVWEADMLGSPRVIDVRQFSGHFALGYITFGDEKLWVTMGLCHVCTLVHHVFTPTPSHTDLCRTRKRRTGLMRPMPRANERPGRHQDIKKFSLMYSSRLRARNIFEFII
ncbi:hypothetical protein NUW54_g7598 [Trametes sanguinea]|uniref:Uncharacterized protein n=1 Tax=Trametes sanguinea TaxID=158606 RepID=A0ACC1PKQ3_9APHY|nr:hypothetical protein NUW54_g7598 [Trametes sanguinea]